MRKRWYRFLDYPLPDRLAIDEAIRLARLEADDAAANCSINGGYDPGGGGQAMEVDKDYQEVRKLESLKKGGLRFITIFKDNA